MIPVYVFYSMFGFQRTGDSIWAAADQMARGFLIGATAGRTTLTGEGLQHNDGHSLLLAATNPAVLAYDPAFSFEVAHIVAAGLHRMYGVGTEEGGTGGRLAGENVFYYLTVYNEPYVQPAEPEELDVAGLLRGIYRYAGVVARGRSAGAAAGLRGVGAMGAAGPGPAGRAVGGGRRGVVGDVVGRAAPRRRRVRAAQPGAPRRRAAGALPAAGARRVGQRGGRGLGLDARAARPDPAVGAGPVHLAGHGRVRAVRHPARRAPALQRRRRVDHGGGARPRWPPGARSTAAR